MPVSSRAKTLLLQFQKRHLNTINIMAKILCRKWLPIFFFLELYLLVCKTKMAYSRLQIILEYTLYFINIVKYSSGQKNKIQI